MNPAERARTLALVGPGRAGTAVAAALAAAGWNVVAVAGRHPDAASTRAVASRLGAPAVAVEDAPRNADLVVIATPDDAIAATAARLAGTISLETLVIHLSGARGLDDLAAVPARVGTLHPLQTLPDADPVRLAGAWCATAGDPETEVLAAELGLRPVALDDADRARYHAAACIASNHLVALLAQVERVAPVPLEALLPLMRATLDNVAEQGARAALTGPVQRGDVATVRAHLHALPAEEHATYRALAREAQRVAGREGDADLDVVLG